MAIPNMDDLTPISVDGIELLPYTTNVQIFKSTPAVEVPSKLNALAVDLKTWNNTELGAKGEDYLNTSMGDITNHLNTSMETITDYVNSVVVDNQNTFTSTMTKNWEEYQTDLNSNLNKYIGVSAGYSVGQIQEINLGKTTVTEVESGNIVKITNGIEEILFTRDNDGNIVKFKKTLTVDGISSSKEFIVSYDEENIKLTEV